MMMMMMYRYVVWCVVARRNCTVYTYTVPGTWYMVHRKERSQRANEKDKRNSNCWRGRVMLAECPQGGGRLDDVRHINTSGRISHV